MYELAVSFQTQFVLPVPRNFVTARRFTFRDGTCRFLKCCQNFLWSITRDLCLANMIVLRMQFNLNPWYYEGPLSAKQLSNTCREMKNVRKYVELLYRSYVINVFGSLCHFHNQRYQNLKYVSSLRDILYMSLDQLSSLMVASNTWFLKDDY